MNTRRYSTLDTALACVDQALRTLWSTPAGTGRPYPADGEPEATLSPREQRRVAGLMRVNHAGEVCAQALYQGQALTAGNEALRRDLEQAAEEENDHLRWCVTRIRELDDRTSYLNPVWYVGSLALGAAAGLAGDRWNLGFLGETERQVTRHLERHLERLPGADRRSRAIVAQMRTDEARHATDAMAQGGAPLPSPIPLLMTLASRVMTTTSYRL